MGKMAHHIPDAMLAAYAAGTLCEAFSLVVAAHVSLCDECRVALSAHEAVGGVVLDNLAQEPVSSDMKASVLAALDAPAPIEVATERQGIYPSPIVERLKNAAPTWKNLGMGVKQDILFRNAAGSARLLYIPPGVAVPDHSHQGLELTLVLQGSFSDETGHFGVGDVEVADDDIEHTPTADAGAPCICLAATEAPLQFNGFWPKLLQPIFKI